MNRVFQSFLSKRSRFNFRRTMGIIILLITSITSQAEVADETETETEAAIDVLKLVTAAVDQTRGLSSEGAMSMKIKRPSWERTSSLLTWTRGRKDALIRFTAPARDAGNAMLKQGDRMWTYNPKLNRNIRLPNSMMSQSWAGSDFSYNDLSRSDKWLRHYSLILVNTESESGYTIYTVDAVPHEDAPVVWGKERMIIRDDLVLLEQTFFDQDMQPVKQLKSLEIGELGGRMMATRMRMTDLEEPDNFTEVSYENMSFDVELEDRLFTVFALQSGQAR